MKSVLLSVRPQHVANILNGIKTLEIRKRFPKDYVGWVYIYATKDKQLYCHRHVHNDKWGTLEYIELNGKVVARFWCDKVDNYVNGVKLTFENGNYIFGTNADFEKILKPSCLTEDELYDYCEDLSFKAIHITNLDPFDKPKEISEFYTTNLDKDLIKLFDNSIQLPNGTWVKPLTRAPQSWCYIEV